MSPGSLSADSRRSTYKRERTTAAESSSRACGWLVPDRVDVRSRRQPFAEQHRFGRRGRRAHDVGAAHGVGTGRRDGRVEPEPLAPPASRACRRGRAFRLQTRSDVIGANGAHRLEMRVRLHAGADDRERRRVLRAKRSRRDGGHGGGANGGDRRRVEERGETAVVGIEQQHRALMRVERGAVVARKHRDDLGADRLRRRRGSPA